MSSVTGDDASSVHHFLIFKSATGTGGWTLIDDYQYSSHTASYIYLSDFKMFGNTIYTQFVASDGTAGDQWDGFLYHTIIRKGASLGTSWSVIDDFFHVSTTSRSTFGSLFVIRTSWSIVDSYNPGTNPTYGFGLVRNFLGDLPVTGNKYDPGYTSGSWVVRRIPCI